MSTTLVPYDSDGSKLGNELGKKQTTWTECDNPWDYDLWDGTSEAVTADADGIYHITKCSQFYWLMSGNASKKHVIIEKDLVFNEGWEDAKNWTTSSGKRVFNKRSDINGSIIDGNGHAIYGLYYNLGTTAETGGMFGIGAVTGVSTIIKDLMVRYSFFYAYKNNGVFIRDWGKGQNLSSIKNIIVDNTKFDCGQVSAGYGACAIGFGESNYRANKQELGVAFSNCLMNFKSGGNSAVVSRGNGSMTLQGKGYSLSVNNTKTVSNTVKSCIDTSRLGLSGGSEQYYANNTNLTEYGTSCSDVNDAISRYNAAVPDVRPVTVYDDGITFADYSTYDKNKYKYEDGKWYEKTEVLNLYVVKK